ncbi:RNase adapter RapZ [Anaerocolumna sp. AGMB13025]|jgi:RNase adapter protein RapZ|uniref:RNase adapter RapZ n=1 Tax=Anaerocolumna sp. AGMB13025 TaxID=3039116 RepID=UPI00241CC6AD|nr:RNase adapter RapZ [Anaerocolumna sp. AGMB13025]WFR56772.1 RNase adapter RapZ [Anaerocolumna sp. AGMB13025]
MRMVIVTGMSGAGKSSVLKMLEDAGYFCVDNLPIQLIYKLVQLTVNGSEEFDKVALGVDIRSGQALEELDEVLEQMKRERCKYEILFLDAKTEVLVKRYKETRRTHPLSGSGRVEQGIEDERDKLEFIKKKADVIIDTSQMLIRELKSEVDKIYLKNEKYNNFFITVLSFGFKYGIPMDSDLVFDVRFLPNPFYDPELKYQTGNDKPVRDFVMSSDMAVTFLDKLEDMITFLIPNYILEGKNQLVISIGCTGGKHRSVTLANALTSRLGKLSYGIKVEHRDIEKDAKR